jgi:hypothetical protein
LSFVDKDADVGSGGGVFHRFDKRRFAMSCRHVGDENSVVDVEQNKSQQAPRPNDESNWRDLARNVSTCQIIDHTEVIGLYLPQYIVEGQL